MKQKPPDPSRAVAKVVFAKLYEKLVKKFQISKIAKILK